MYSYQLDLTIISERIFWKEMAGRPIECDRDEAARKATRRFWDCGYTGTSVADLVAETGLNRFGLYGEFGGKKGMFLKACEVYSESAQRCVFKPLSESSNPEESLHQFFAGVVAAQLDDNKPGGCLMANTLAEQGCTDPEIQQAVQDHFKAVEEAFAHTLRRAADKKGTDESARVAAALLLNSLLGLVQLARLKPGREVLESVGNNAVRAAIRVAREK